MSRPRQAASRLGAVDGAMSFAEIGAELGISRHLARAIYEGAIRKLRRNPAGFDLLDELYDYHRHLSARSAECQLARDSFDFRFSELPYL